MRRTLHQICHKIGDTSAINDVQPVSGGSISQAYKVTTDEAQYFVKVNRHVPVDFFKKEAEGLTLLRSTGALRVPKVYGYSAVSAAVPGFIAMEWLEGQEAIGTDVRLGRGLAALHGACHDRYGLAEDNYIGALPQPNGWCDDWVAFLRDKRLGHQARLAAERGRLPKSRQMMLDRLLQSLDKWIPHKGQPALLHGDLWGGNWLAGPGGEPCLIDPAVFYGEREFELAFTELFGGFSERFYASYTEMSPLSPGYEERKPIYQLYYLLVHLTLFGEAYGPAVDRVLTYYVG